MCVIVAASSGEEGPSARGLLHHQQPPVMELLHVTARAPAAQARRVVRARARAAAGRLRSPNAGAGRRGVDQNIQP